MTFQEEHPDGLELSKAVTALFEKAGKDRVAYTFQDITLQDLYSEVKPEDVDLKTYATNKVLLKTGGLISAAMDTVTEKEMALAMAKMGGFGVIHRNLSIDEQVEMVNWVRRKIHHRGMIEKPITFKPYNTLAEVEKLLREEHYEFTSFPVVDDQGKLLGLFTKSESKFSEEENPKVGGVMKPLEELVLADEHTTPEQAYKAMMAEKVNKLPVIDKNGVLKGMYVLRDLKEDNYKKEYFSLDEEGHFLVAAAVGTGRDELERAEALISKGCKVLVIDSSHGACKDVKEQLRMLKRFDVQVIAGNVASYQAAKSLLDPDCLPDALKVGIGPGSTCTTRLVSGHRVPQLTAVYQAWKAVKEFAARHGKAIPVISDGGIQCSGDVVKAYAAGASAVMIGGLLAGTYQSPSPVTIIQGEEYKPLRGMGSKEAMQERTGSRKRYNYEGFPEGLLSSSQAVKVVAEGVSGYVPVKGDAYELLGELIGGLKVGLAHSGASTIHEFQGKAVPWVQTINGFREGKPSI